MKLVKRKMTASTSKTIPNVPVTALEKYNAPITNASRMRTVRSAVPIFFFM